MIHRVVFAALVVHMAGLAVATDEKAKVPTPSNQDDPIGRKLSERIGSYRQNLSLHRDNDGKRESWIREYEGLTVDEKIRYCIFQLRNESWAEWNRPVGDNPYSKEPEGSASQELVRLGRPAIAVFLPALESRVGTKIYPSFHPMDRPWLVQDAALDIIENISCRRFRQKTCLPMFSDTGEGEHRQVQKTIADWWERNKGLDEIQWAKDVLLSDHAVDGGNRGAAIDSLYNRLGKGSYPLLATAYNRLPKQELSDPLEEFETEYNKEAIIRCLLRSPTANERAVFASALGDGPLAIRIDGATGLWAIGDASGLEVIVKETEESLKEWGMKANASDYEEQVSFLLRCNTAHSREVIYKCLRGANSYLREEAIRSILLLRMEKAVRALPELLDDPDDPLGGVTAETFTKVVPDAPRYDGSTAETQRSSIEKIGRWWKENGPKLKWDEKRGILALPKKE